MIAANGVKSIMPALGMMRRKGARSGSVSLYEITASIFVGLGENQDRIALKIIATVSASHSTLIKLNKNAITAYLPNSLALL